MTQRVYTVSGSLAGKSFSGTVKRDGVSETNAETSPALAAGSAATLTTRTSDTVGVITMTTGHGQTDGTFDIYWSGATPGCRRGVTATFAVNAMSISLGTGDNLPADESAVVVDKQEILDFDSLHTSIVLALVSQQRRASVEFQEDAGTPILALDLGRYGYDAEPWAWAADTSVTNPFTAAISKVAVSNGSSGGTNTIVIGVLRE
jgi:hypothetical protein